MKIALIGYGKMGHEIEKIAISRNHTIHIIIDVDNIDFVNKPEDLCNIINRINAEINGLF